LRSPSIACGPITIELGGGGRGLVGVLVGVVVGVLVGVLVDVPVGVDVLLGVGVGVTVEVGVDAVGSHRVCGSMLLMLVFYIPLVDKVRRYFTV
jgi:hypothetical protein